MPINSSFCSIIFRWLWMSASFCWASFCSLKSVQITLIAVPSSRSRLVKDSNTGICWESDFIKISSSFFKTGSSKFAVDLNGAGTNGATGGGVICGRAKEDVSDFISFSGAKDICGFNFSNSSKILECSEWTNGSPLSGSSGVREAAVNLPKIFFGKETKTPCYWSSLLRFGRHHGSSRLGIQKCQSSRWKLLAISNDQYFSWKNPQSRNF